MWTNTYIDKIKMKKKHVENDTKKNEMNHLQFKNKLILLNEKNANL